MLNRRHKELISKLKILKANPKEHSKEEKEIEEGTEKSDNVTAPTNRGRLTPKGRSSRSRSSTPSRRSTLQDLERKQQLNVNKTERKMSLEMVSRRDVPSVKVPSTNETDKKSVDSANGRDKGDASFMSERRRSRSSVARADKEEPVPVEKPEVKDTLHVNGLDRGDAAGVNGIIRAYTKSPVPVVPASKEEFSSSSSDRRRSDDDVNDDVISSVKSKSKSCDRPDSPRVEKSKQRAASPILSSKKGSSSSTSSDSGEKQSVRTKPPSIRPHTAEPPRSSSSVVVDDANFFPISNVDQLKLKSLRSRIPRSPPSSRKRHRHGNGRNSPLVVNNNGGPMYSTPKGTHNPPSNNTELNGISVVSDGGENHELDVDVDNEVASLDTNNNNSKPPSIFASPCTNCGLPYCNGVTCVLRRSPLRDTSPQRHDNLEYVVPMERTEGQLRLLITYIQSAY